jgi:hypothetical protein
MLLGLTRLLWTLEWVIDLIRFKGANLVEKKENWLQMDGKVSFLSCFALHSIYVVT